MKAGGSFVLAAFVARRRNVLWSILKVVFQMDELIQVINLIHYNN